MAAKRPFTSLAALVSVAALAAGCGSPDSVQSGDKKTQGTSQQTNAAGGKGAASGDGAKKPGASAPAKVITQAPEETAGAPFAEDKIPAAKGDAGAFPHLKDDVAEPVKLVQQTLNDAKELPIWVGDRLVKVNGTAHTRIYSAGNDGAAAQAAALKHVNQMVESTGATKATHSRLSDEAADAITGWKELDKYSAGYGDVFNQPVTTYAVTVNGKQVWLQVCSNNLQTSVLVVSTT